MIVFDTLSHNCRAKFGLLHRSYFCRVGTVLSGIVHQVIRHASEKHFGVGFCPKKLLAQPQGPKIHMISQFNMQVICQ